MGEIELWGGLECTVARVGNAYSDQSERTGHDDRVDDLDRFASLGLRALRYPALWERAPQWGWLDERLARIRELGMRPIVGLVHHGSGPLHTSLLDPRFPDELAAYAREVAERYPWVEDWTPVNEPLTTARFSGLYGHWFPHRRSEEEFARMVAIQCRGVLLAMRAVRKVNPRARLVQTEDLGRTFATPKLQHQADYENLRRWLSLDLLTGRVDRSHPWYGRLLAMGVPEAELQDFLSGDLAPMTLGFNYYATSERFLDHRLGLYPLSTHGGNGRQSYADTEAVRVPMPPGSTGWLARLRDAWQRYPGVPLAVTEAHIGCAEDEQVRWLVECWRAVKALRAEGADLRAVTVWALFGAVDWCSLLTRRTGRYEPGAFDVGVPGGGAEPRPTLLAEAAAALARNGDFDHPLLREPGWWEREERVHATLRRAG